MDRGLVTGSGERGGGRPRLSEKQNALVRAPKWLIFGAQDIPDLIFQGLIEAVDHRQEMCVSSKIVDCLFRECPPVVQSPVRSGGTKTSMELDEQIAQIASALAGTNDPRTRYPRLLLIVKQKLNLGMDLPGNRTFGHACFKSFPCRPNIFRTNAIERILVQGAGDPLSCLVENSRGICDEGHINVRLL